MDEERIYAAFGLEMPAAEEPAEQPTEPVQEPEEAQEETAEQTEPEEEPEEQSLHERHENAARRRKAEMEAAKAEQQAAIDRAVQDALKAERDKQAKNMQSFFSRAGLKNTVTGEPINSMEEFNGWQEAFDRQKLERDLEQGKLTPKGLETAISQHPLMQQAQEIINRNAEENKQQEQDAFRQQVACELEEIGKMAPGIKSLEDILNMDTGEDFRAAVNRGHTYLEAFKLANFDKLTQRNTQAAKQQALNNARSKNHLSSTRAQGEGAISVPREEMRYFREFMPHATEAEIQKYYQKYKGDKNV